MSKIQESNLELVIGGVSRGAARFLGILVGCVASGVIDSIWILAMNKATRGSGLTENEINALKCGPLTLSTITCIVAGGCIADALWKMADRIEKRNAVR